MAENEGVKEGKEKKGGGAKPAKTCAKRACGWAADSMPD